MRPPAYTHGHHESVLRSHRWRTAENSAAYLIPHLRPGLTLLDVGCGPGTITTDFAARLSPARVCGIDPSADVVSAAQRDHPGIEFATGDVYSMPFDDGSWDVVHAHQVLQHLPDPVAALKEMRRVVRPGGIVAARDSDYAAFTWHPADERLMRWLALYHDIARSNGGEPDAGRYLRLSQWTGLARARNCPSSGSLERPASEAAQEFQEDTNSSIRRRERGRTVTGGVVRFPLRKLSSCCLRSKISRSGSISNPPPYLWAAQGKIPCQKIHGLIRFDREKVTRWLDSFDREPSKFWSSQPHANRSAIDELIEAAKRDAYTPRGETRPTASPTRKEQNNGAR